MTLPRRFLYAVHNVVSLAHAEQYASVLNAAFPHAAHHVTYVEEDHFFPYMSRFSTAPGLPVVPFTEALRQPWDVAIFANHGGAHLLPARTLKVHIQHGLGAGKIAHGTNHTYGRPWVEVNGRVIYDLFLESSVAEAERIVRQYPHVEGRLRVVGSLAAEELLRLDGQRQTLRAELGFSGTRNVAFLSTWGPHSLFATLAYNSARLWRSFGPGDHLLFVLHPHLVASHDTRMVLARWQREYPHLRMSFTHLDRTARQFMVASDCAITDNTSLGLLFTLLRKPLFTYRPLDLTRSRLDASSTTAALLRALPAICIAAETEVPGALRQSLGAVTVTAGRVVSNVGNAPDRLVEVLTEALEQRRAPGFAAPSPG